MAVSYSLDATHAALYVSVLHAQVHRTIELEAGSLMVDLDAAGHICGIEVLGLRRPVDLDSVWACGALSDDKRVVALYCSPAILVRSLDDQAFTNSRSSLGLASQRDGQIT